MSEQRGAAPLPAAASHNPEQQSTSMSARRRGPWRWLVALSATALLVVSGSGLVAFAQTGGGPAAGPSFLPAGTAVYFELRADLPAGQDEALAQMMAHFPGFADAANFDPKVDAAIDQMLLDSTDGIIGWVADVQPWFDGEISGGIMGDLAAVANGGEDPDILLGVAVSDPAAVDAFLEKVRSGPDMEDVSEEPYAGTTIVSDGDAAYAVTEDLLLLGNGVEQVKSGLDTLAGEQASLASDESFQTAFARVPDARLGAGYFDFEAFRPLIEAALEQVAEGDLGGMTGLEGAAGGMDATALLGQLPVDLTWYSAVRDDGATFEAFVTPAEGSPAMAVGDSVLAGFFPGTAQLYLEARNIGALIGTALDQLVAQMGDQAADLDQLGGMLGEPGSSLADVVGWAGDLAVGAAVEGEAAWVGIGVEIADQDAADEFVTGLLGLAGLLAMQEDSGITVTEAEVAGVPVTTIVIEGLAGQMPLPIDPTISLALTDGALLLGTGDFVANALTLEDDASLAGSAGYQEAVAAVGTPNLGQLYASVGGLLDGLAPILPAMMDGYEEMAPFLEPFDRFVAASGETEEGILTTTVMLFLR